MDDQDSANLAAARSEEIQRLDRQNKVMRHALKTARGQLVAWMLREVGVEAANRHVSYIDIALKSPTPQE